MKHRTLLTALIVEVAIASLAWTQTAPLNFTRFDIDFDTGVARNESDNAEILFDAVLPAGNVPWLQLRFAPHDLPDGSYLLLTSLLDGGQQRLDAQSLQEWQHYSAYLNGSQVRIVLVAAPHSENRVQVIELLTGQWEFGDSPATQCGSSDDRVASNEPARGRLLNIGCTATIFGHLSGRSCLITAGHCLDSSTAVNTVEFNVPLSLPSGTLQHPPPQHQYAVDVASRTFTNGGVGNDWGLFRVFDNANTGLQPYEAQSAALHLAAAAPASGSLDLVGYGVDSGTANQTQQRGTGPITSLVGTALYHQVDTTGGNSGSAIVDLATGRMVAIHTHGGCSTSGGGSNASTAIQHAGLQAALAGYCNGGAIECIGDLDHDNAVDLDDLAYFLTGYGCNAPACFCDLDNDADCDLADLADLLANYGKICN